MERNTLPKNMTYTQKKTIYVYVLTAKIKSGKTNFARQLYQRERKTKTTTAEA